MISGLTLDNLSLQRGERMLVTGLSVVLRAGEAAALLGANGAGKTTLLRAIAGFVRPAAGRITFESATGPLDAADARAAHVHLVGHQDGLKTSRTAWEELRFQAA